MGGAPYNTALAAARLGADVHFVGGLSRDRFGAGLTDRLIADGVSVAHSPRSERPTTLAAAEIDEGGAATYRFYIDGTSAPAVGADDVALAVEELAGVDSGIFFTGGLGLVLEPIAASIVGAIDRLDDGTLFMLDVNCRPAVVDDRDSYVARVWRAVERADIVKVSGEDLAYLLPDLDVDAASAKLIAGGARVVVVTAGSASTTVLDVDRSIEVHVPPISGGVVDTIGAGDSFGAGVLAWWAASGLGRGDVSEANVASAVAAGHAVAGIVVTRRGADPPYLSELSIDWPI